MDESAQNWRQLILGRVGGNVLLVLLTILVAYLGLYRHMRFFRVPSASMEPTLLVSDYLVTMRDAKYFPGDVVVLNDPMEKGAYLVKRIIATGGDLVEVTGGACFVNNEYVSEPYTKEPPNYTFGPYRVPENCVLVFGDNRNNSEDSHQWAQPAQPVSAIVGRVRFIYYPYNRWGALPETPSVTTPRILASLQTIPLPSPPFSR